MSATPGAAPAQAQPANAAELCTPDVMRLCSHVIPDRNRIVRCLTSKRRQLSSGCRTVMSPRKGRKAKRHARRS